jgi:hypothetical protein
MESAVIARQLWNSCYGVLGILRSTGLKLVRSKDDAGEIDRPWPARAAARQT